MSRAVWLLSLSVLMFAVPARADDGGVERDEGLRGLLVKVEQARTAEKLAKMELDTLLETKTMKHPKVAVAFLRWKTLRTMTEHSTQAYQDARRAKGLPAAPIPSALAGDTKLTKARADVELSRARLRILLEQLAVVVEELRALQGNKTDQHPKVRGALNRKATLDTKIAALKTQIAREQEHVSWLERERGKAAGGSTSGLEAKVESLQKEVRALRGDIAEMKSLLRKALAK